MKVFIMDMLCMVPIYNRYLCNALQATNPDTFLGSISFHLQPGYFAKHKVHRQPGMIDIVSRFSFRSRNVRQLLKLAEYLLNLISLTVRFLFVRPDIIHVQWIPLVIRMPVELWFLRFFQSRGVKLVYTVHNILPHDSGERYREQFKTIYAMMDLLVCHTRQIQQQLIDSFAVPPVKTAIIPHGPAFHDALTISRQEARKRLSVGEDKTIVLCFGVIRPYKGVEFLLEAWQAIDAARPDAMLIIAGNGDLEYLSNIRLTVEQLSLTDSVRLDLRFIPDDELPMYYQAADILVYPYRDIAQSGALLTGMTFGKPIIATAVGGFCEVLQDRKTALFIEYGNCTQFAAALANLIDDGEVRARMGQAVLDEVRSNYSWETIAEKTIACYHQALKTE